MTESSHVPRIEIEYNPRSEWTSRWGATYWYMHPGLPGSGEFLTSFSRYGSSRRIALSRLERELEMMAATEAAKKNKEIIEL